MPTTNKKVSKRQKLSVIKREPLRKKAHGALFAGLITAALGGFYFMTFSSAAIVPSIAHPISFGDTFNSGSMNGWTKYDEGTVDGPSAWSVDASNRLQQSSNIYGGSSAASDISKPGTELVAGSSSWKNYDYSVIVRPLDDDDVGVVFRFKDTNNYYRFSMDKERSYQRLVKKVNGQYTSLAQNTGGYVSDTPYVIRTVAVGSRIMIFVNGTLTFDVTDASHSTGKIGVYTWGSSMTKFDGVNAKIEDADDSFSIAVVPDTQYESASYPAMLDSQMKWLASNRASLNLAMVLQEGDVVDASSQPTQWKNATAGYMQINGKVPFVVAAGNHDMFTLDYASGAPYTITRTPFNTFISSLSDYSPSGTYQPNDFLNTFKLFSAGGVDMVVINVEFGANDQILAWAGSIADKYAGRHVLLLTHDYANEKNGLRGSVATDQYLPKNYHSDMNNGVDMWEEFVKTHPNIQFVFSGHVIAPVSATQNYSVGRFTANNLAGRQVYQTLTNYQTLSPGGQGYLRIFKFYPSLSKVDVTTYSPYKNTYLTDSINKFSYSGVDLKSWAP